VRLRAIALQRGASPGCASGLRRRRLQGRQRSFRTRPATACCAGSSRLSISIRTTTGARLGGDEFALLLAGVPDESVASFVVERIRLGIAGRAFTSGSTAIGASCSFGFVRVGPEQAGRENLAEELLTCADAALYESKRRGKNAATVGALRPRPPATDGG
jgi:hypothetical protein